MASDTVAVNVDESMFKEDQLGRKWDRCITDTIIKFTAGFAIGAVFAVLFTKRRKWPMIIGGGFGIGMAYSNCQRDLNSMLNSVPSDCD